MGPIELIINAFYQIIQSKEFVYYQNYNSFVSW